MRESGFKHVLHPSDFTKASEVAYDHALKIALAGELTLTTVHVNVTPVDRGHFPSARDKLMHWRVIPSNGCVPEKISTGLCVKKIQLTEPNPVQAIMRRLEKKPACLIVLANSRQDNRPRWMNKAVSEPIARDSGTKTLFLPHGARGFVDHDTGDVTLRRVLIAVDRKPDPQHAIHAAVKLADLLGCHRGVTFAKVHVGHENNVPEPLLPQDKRWSWMSSVRKGDVVTEILSVATNMLADLIVLTTQGHNGFLDALRGSTTERIVRAANCPVLAVPA
jgi:nucleotide-binding universal stress UspA family protein